jgi:nucleoside-diphosphate-sugar epimerase
MNILITGYTGFVGSQLVKKLSDRNLSGVDILQNNSVHHHFQWEELGQCKDQNCIVHLAGKAHDTRDMTSMEEYFDINLGLTQKIFDLFLASSATKFIFFSSVKAVADNINGEILTEDAICNPKTPYGLSKLAAEQYIFSKPLSNDKKIYILRPCMIHGPGNKGNLNLLFKLQQKGLPWPLGAFENKRSFCSIDNILYVVQQLIDGNIESGIYQVADDVALSTNDLIRLMALSQKKKAKIWRISPKLIKVIARVGDFFHLPLNSERLSKLSESYIVSNKKIKHVLGLEKMPVSAVIGLQKTFEFFKK